MLTHTLRALLSVPEIDNVLTVVHEDDAALYRDAAVEDARLLEPALGGAERALSVLAGLEALSEDPPEKIMIHDAARPFISPSVIKDVLRALDDADGAIAALPVVDALRRSVPGRSGDLYDAPVDRDGVWRAQTPQAFRFDAILAAHRANADPKAADDAEIARAAGLSVQLVEGDPDNFKITTPRDFAYAERQLERRLEETRIGEGYDVHALVAGDGVILCGVRIPFEKSLSGHSDADVGMHALTDAIFGAIAEGDIGRWFPPSEAKWKGAASEIFLAKAVERVRTRGGRIINVDLTIICERPKIGPHADAMRAELARIMAVDIGRVSVKATTSERLGFTGREEGIAAMATATVALRADAP